MKDEKLNSLKNNFKKLYSFDFFMYIYKKVNKMGLLLSGETSTFQDWNIKDILDLRYKSTKEEAERIKQYEWDETIGPYCNGLTYLEIEQLNNTYNNY